MGLFNSNKILLYFAINNVIVAIFDIKYEHETTA